MCVVLDSELHRALQFHSFEDICLAEEIFKNFQAIMRQIPHCLTGFFRHIAHYVISLINSKIVKK